MLQANKLSNTFKPQNIGDINFKSYSHIVEEEKQPTEKLYLSNSQYNRSLILRKFIERLSEKFGDNLIISNKFRTPTTIYNADNIEKNFNTMFTTWCCMHVRFIINNYEYNLELDRNPFLDGNWFYANQIFQFGADCIRTDLKNRYFTADYCLINPFNVNDLFDNFYSSDCDIEANVNALFDYFMSNVYCKGLKPNGNRIFTLANAENEYNIKTVNNKEIIFG